jgi:pyruvate,orthophosphate dikinase
MDPRAANQERLPFRRDYARARDGRAPSEGTRLNYVSCSPFRVPIARLAAAQAALVEQGFTAKHDKLTPVR